VVRLADGEALPDATGRVGEHHQPAAGGGHRAGRVRHRRDPVALVVVGAAEQDQHAVRPDE
jgi:hypothetical protein